VLAVGTAWPTGIVPVIPLLFHGYADVIVTVALIRLPFVLGSDDSTAALLFYEIVGAGPACDALRALRVPGASAD
jgi:hypothetical protein